MSANISVGSKFEEGISRLLQIIGQPARIQILVVIQEQEACVCHLEAVLGMRQASISQHLIVLRKAGLVSTHREGRNIFYRLAQPGVMELIQRAASIQGIEPSDLRALSARPIPECPCPQCNPALDPDFTCQKARSSAARQTEPSTRSE